MKKMRVIADIPSMDNVSDIARNGTASVEFATFLRDIRRSIHQHPELGFKEHRTSEFVRSILEQHGLAVTGPLAETGLYTDIEGPHDGPVIAYRADMDALPIADAKSVAYASCHPGIAHLCGHDAHTAVGIGVALILHRNREHLRGTVRVLFQPDEEGAPGAAQGEISIQEGASRWRAKYLCNSRRSLAGVGQIRCAGRPCYVPVLRYRFQPFASRHQAPVTRRVPMKLWIPSGWLQLRSPMRSIKSLGVLRMRRTRHPF